ncbi:hypothetical protein CJF31_00006125 [Rutstroemia sp. NJR-2017a BVV2]|nr:hypothetical protein CJF31_00006125 [Rutstroemia sp. NJR-2017a BVV2]
METAENQRQNLPKVSPEPNLTPHIRSIKRLRDLALKRQEVVRAEILKREKTRAAIFARKNVGDCDDRFMRELRILDSLGKLQEFKTLMILASELQQARDILGPIEQDSFDLDQEWEWQATELAEVEEDIYYEFHEDFEEAASLPPASLSSSSDSYQGLPDIANEYLGDQFEDRKEDIRYGELPTDRSIAHECISSTTLEANPQQQIADLDLSPGDAPLSSSISPPYDERLGPNQLDRHNRAPEFEITEPESVPIQDNQEGSDSEIHPLNELNYQPEDSVTGDSLTAMQKITIWMIESTIISKWDAYSIKWSFLFENEKEVPSWVILVVYLVHHNHLPDVYHQRSAEEITLSLPHFPASKESESKSDTKTIEPKHSCGVPTPPMSITSLDLSGAPPAENGSFDVINSLTFGSLAYESTDNGGGFTAHKLDSHEVSRNQAGSALSEYPSVCSKEMNSSYLHGPQHDTGELLKCTTATIGESSRLNTSPTASHHHHDTTKDHEVEEVIESSELDGGEENLPIIDSEDRLKGSTCARCWHKRSSCTSEQVTENLSTAENQTKSCKNPMEGDTFSSPLKPFTVQTLTRAVTIYHEDQKKHQQRLGSFNHEVTEISGDKPTQANGPNGNINDTGTSDSLGTKKIKPPISRQLSLPMNSETQSPPRRASEPMKQTLGHQNLRQRVLSNLGFPIVRPPFFRFHSHQPGLERRPSNKTHHLQKPTVYNEKKIGRQLSITDGKRKQ